MCKYITATNKSKMKTIDNDESKKPQKSSLAASDYSNTTKSLDIPADLLFGGVSFSGSRSQSMLLF